MAERPAPPRTGSCAEPARCRVPPCRALQARGGIQRQPAPNSTRRRTSGGSACCVMPAAHGSRSPHWTQTVAGKLTRPRLHNCHELKRKCTLVLAEFESTVPWVHTACKHCAWGLLPCCGWRAAGWPSMRLSRPWRRPSASSCHTPTSMSSSSSCARPSQRCAAAPVPCYI